MLVKCRIGISPYGPTDKMTIIYSKYNFTPTQTHKLYNLAFYIDNN